MRPTAYALMTVCVLAGPALGATDESLGAWRLICGEDGCVARASVAADDGGQERVVDLFLGRGPGGVPTLSLITDLAVRVAPGAGIARSEAYVTAPSWSADFVTCGPDGCQATGFLDPDALRGAQDPIAVLVSPNGETLAVPLDLSGMDAALSAIEKAAPGAPAR